MHVNCNCGGGVNCNCGGGGGGGGVNGCNRSVKSQAVQQGRSQDFSRGGFSLQKFC